MTPAININPGSKDPVPAAPQAEFLPKDDYNVKLVSNVGPTDYTNPEPLDKYDMVRLWLREFEGVQPRLQWSCQPRVSLFLSLSLKNKICRQWVRTRIDCSCGKAPTIDITKRVDAVYE